MLETPAPGWEHTRIPFPAETTCRLRPGPAPDSPLVLLCHGMGEDPEQAIGGWPAVTALPAHLVVPAAPYPYEIRGEEGIRIGRAWYLYDGGPELFRETLARSSRWIGGYLEELETERGWRPRRRALVGYSMGAYFGYVAALSRPDLFSHLVAVAGRLKTSFAAAALAEGGPLRTLVLHGEKDRAVDVEAARRSADALRAAGYAVELELLPGGHRLTPDRDVRAADWLASAWAGAGS